VRGYLEPGEEVRINERPHGAALAKPMGRALALAIAGAVVVLVGSSLTWGVAAVGALLVAAGAVAAFVAVWRWDRTHVVLTSQKLFVVYGLAQRRAASHGSTRSSSSRAPWGGRSTTGPLSPATSRFRSSPIRAASAA